MNINSTFFFNIIYQNLIDQYKARIQFEYINSFTNQDLLTFKIKIKDQEVFASFST